MLFLSPEIRRWPWRQIVVCGRLVVALLSGGVASRFHLVDLVANAAAASVEEVVAFLVVVVAAVLPVVRIVLFLGQVRQSLKVMQHRSVVKRRHC